MIRIRSALFNLLFFGFTALVVVFGLPLLAFHPDVMHRYLRGWAWGSLWLLRVICGIRLRVTGAENLPLDGPALIAAQHQSAFDTVVWHALLPRPAYVMKEELLRIPRLGGDGAARPLHPRGPGGGRLLAEAARAGHALGGRRRVPGGDLPGGDALRPRGGAALAARLRGHGGGDEPAGGARRDQLRAVSGASGPSPSGRGC